MPAPTAPHDPTLSQHYQGLETLTDILFRFPETSVLVSEVMMVIKKTMRADNVAILLPDAQNHELQIYNTVGPEQQIAHDIHIPIGQGIAGRIMASGQPLIVEDLAKSEVINPLLRERLRSLLGVPLRVAGRVVGVLHVSTLLARQFGPNDVAMLEYLADRIAPGIERSQQIENIHASYMQEATRATALAQAQQETDAFISMASHEMRTPLTALMLNIEMTQRRFARWLDGTKPMNIDQLKEVAPLLADGYEQALRLNHLIDDLLDASRAASQRLQFHPEQLDLNLLAKEVVEELRHLWPQRQLTLTLSKKSGTVVMADPQRIRQVLSNFLTNAHRYSPLAEPIAVTVHAMAQTIQIMVIDNGPGIAEADQTRIWERFHQVAQSVVYNGSASGLGLGLYICKSLIEQQGGLVGLQSDVGHGARFWFALPRSQP